MSAAHSAKQGGYFLLVGATAAAVHFAVLALAVEGAHVPPLSANLIAFAVAFCVACLGAAYYLPLWFAVTLAVTAFSFIAGKYWAFHAKPTPLRSGGGLGRGCENPRSDDTP